MNFNDLLSFVCCPACQSTLARDSVEDHLVCPACACNYPIRHGIPRLLSSSLREAIGGLCTAVSEEEKVATACSFGFEWSKFPEMYKEWEDAFFEYMQPHGADFFMNKRVLDAGCGSGRFAYYAGKFSRELWAVDLGPAVEVAHRNTRSLPNVQVVQADLYQLPFPEESFDVIFSIGVLHHLPDPEAAFRNLLRYLKPGGEMRVYLYWKPERQPIKSLLLRAVNALRGLTRRLPYPLIHALAYPAAALAFLLFVWPYQLLKAVGLSWVAEQIPMKQYAKYPFRVCVNDQFDRFSAPIENRYTQKEVERWFQRARLEEISVVPNYGWVAMAKKSYSTLATPGSVS